jgi:hypothetical protein
MLDAMNKNEGSNAEKKVTTMNHEYICTCKTCTTSTQAPLAGQSDTPTYMFYQNLKLKTRTQSCFLEKKRRNFVTSYFLVVKLCDLLCYVFD